MRNTLTAGRRGCWVVKRRQVQQELDRIYEERAKWDGGSGPFSRRQIMRRELILFKQQILYGLEEAQAIGDKRKSAFWLKVYRLVNQMIAELESR